VSEGIRLQKFLAEAGLASRRKAEALITAGRVQVNAKTVTELGTRVDPARDLVTVDGGLVSQREEKSYYLLYKPSGCVTTASDPQGRPTALEYLRGVKERVFAVGRLDYDAEGALLLTDDGELANRLAHPRYGHRRIYLAKVRGEPPEGALERLLAGVRLEDGPAKALEAAIHERVEKNVWVRLAVAEGRTHLVKRLCEAVGLQIQRLFRPEFGGVTVEGLRPGKFRSLTAVEVRRMKALVGLGDGPAAAATAGVPAVLLPRAARRHGHGPPAPPEPGAPPREARPPREVLREQREESREPARGPRRGGRGSQDARGASGARAGGRAGPRESPDARGRQRGEREGQGERRPGGARGASSERGAQRPARETTREDRPSSARAAPAPARAEQPARPRQGGWPGAGPSRAGGRAPATGGPRARPGGRPGGRSR
jgi:23S rRNA pseudouridine2605 synthase